MDTAAFEGRRNSTSDRLKPAPVFKQPVTYHYAIHYHTTRMQKLAKAFKVYRLMALTLFCVAAGISIGLLCRPYAKDWPERRFMYIELPGELYLRFLRLMILPLLVSNVILSFGTIQGKISSRLGKVAGCLYLCSNLIAITLAIFIALIMKPGRGGSGRMGPGLEPAHHAMNADRLIAEIDDRVANQQLQREYQESLARYRQYHPMFYHTNSEASLAQAVGEERGFGLLWNAKPSQQGQIKQQVVETVLQQASAKQVVHNATSLSPKPQALSINLTIATDGGNKLNKSAMLTGELAQLVVNGDERGRVVGSAGALDEATAIETSRIGLSTRLPIDVILDVLRHLFPDSLVGATLHQSRTRLFTPRELKIDENGTTSPSPQLWPMGHELVNQPNIIGLLAISVLTGVVLSHMDEAGRPLLDLCACVSELSLRVGMGAIHMAPICIMFLLISQVSRATDLSQIAGELFMYSVTVSLALFLHGFIILPAIYYFVTKKSPFKFLKGLAQALVAAFATSSSSATMALMLNCLSELDVNLIIVRAFGPLGSVFNMNGTSIFEAVAVIFIAQTLDVRMPTTSLLLIGLCSAIASLSTSGIPSSGLMTMVIALNAINLPVLELSLVYIVDFIIDRFRTVVNVWSGAIVCGLIDHICPEELFEEEMGPERYQEMIKYRGSRSSLASRKMSQEPGERKPQVISVTITPPPSNESSNI